MDIIPLAGMLLALLIVVVLAGSVLLFPLTRRLGRLLELRIEDRQGGAAPADQVEELTRVVEALQAEVERLAERQAFTDRLLEAGPRHRPASPDPSRPEAGSETDTGVAS